MSDTEFLDFIKKVRSRAFEELYQEVKWADWPIGSLVVILKAIEKLDNDEEALIEQYVKRINRNVGNHYDWSSNT